MKRGDRMNDLISRHGALYHIRKRLIEAANNNVGFNCDAGTVFEDIAQDRLKPWLEELPDAELEAIERYTKAMHEWLLNYKKEVSEIEIQSKYTPNEILSLFLDDWEKEWLT